MMRALVCTVALLFVLPCLPGVAAEDQGKPNILVIFGDDIGQSNVSAYSHGPDGLPDAEHRPHRP